MNSMNSMRGSKGSSTKLFFALIFVNVSLKRNVCLVVAVVARTAVPILMHHSSNFKFKKGGDVYELSPQRSLSQVWLGNNTIPPRELIRIGGSFRNPGIPCFTPDHLAIFDQITIEAAPLSQLRQNH